VSRGRAVRAAPPGGASSGSQEPGELAALHRGLDAVTRLTAATARAETPEGLYEAALDAVEAALGVERAAVLLVDPDGVMRFKAWRGLSDAYREAIQGHSPWPAGATEAEPVLVPDAAADSGLEGLRPLLEAEKIGALAFFPLLQPGRLLGKFMAYHRTPHRFTPAEVMLGGLIAGQVAFAVERHLGEAALRDRERELADCVQQVPLGLHWLDARGTVVQANQAALDLLGYPAGEYVGRRLSEFHVDPVGMEAALDRLAGREDVPDLEAALRHRDGSIRYVTISLSARWQDGRFDHIRSFTRDDTDRRRADETQERLAAIVDSSNDAVISKDLNGMIQTWNPAAERLFGYTAQEAIGRPITMLIPREALREEAEILARIQMGVRIAHYETVRIRKDGRPIDVSLAISPVRDGAGRIIGASKIARDITAWKQAEQERERLLAQEQEARTEAVAANRAKDDFLATLSHELRTPLNAILGWTHVLATARHDQELVGRALDTIGRNARQQARLIEDLLDLSSIRGGKLRLDLRPVDLVAVLAAAIETIRPAAEEKGLEIQSSFEPLVEPVNGDQARLQQIFWNILANAVKFTPRRGRLDIRLEQDGQEAVISITDTGMGMRPETLAVIFERFRQADSSVTRTYGGLGLGLAIVRELVEMHQGTVAATSPGEGGGTTLRVRLPTMQVRQSRRSAGTASPPQPSRCDGLHTVLVDDDGDGRELLAHFLRRCGARVTAVDSVEAALAAMAEDRPDVLVSDLAMPGVDGYELIRRVRALPGGNGIAAVALTAHATGGVRLHALQAGFDLYLVKPVDPAELSTVLSRLARRSRLDPGAARIEPGTGSRAEGPSAPSP
jgi:PAS domain S-box-containing protein